MRTDPAPRRTRTSILVALSVMAVLASLIMPWMPTAPATEAEAASASNFDAGNIISDANFYAGGSMSAAAVQAFMQQRRPDCAAGYTCLPQYAQATPTMAANRYCGAIGGSAWESAASIVSRIAVACNVSPRVLLVLLEKEQSLVTHRSPSATRYSSATGFACPDTAPCDSSYGGFFYQVYYAARQFQVYRAFPTSYNHQPGAWNNILFHPNAACGTSRVYVANQATAGLYNYTPYQPNAAALANLYGTGDACSAYGNRNFWRIFSDWFGDPRGNLPGDMSPFGELQSVQAAPDRVRLQGYVLDASAPTTPIQVHMYINGQWGGQFTANVNRPDVGAAYPTYGNAHGFDIQFGVGSGTFEACLYGINVGDGENRLLTCRTISTPTGSPVGSLEAAVANGRTASMTGWALDPDTTAPVAIHAYVNGAWGGAYTANARRADVGNAYWGYGAEHGIAIGVPIPVGTSEVCLFAINVGAGTNASLGCRTVSNASGPPVGSWEATSVTFGAISVRGWGLDPDTANPISVRVSVDGRTVGAFAADGARTDVGRAYPGYGDGHGFLGHIPMTGGTRSVCLTLVGVGAGGDSSLGCRAVQVPGGSPIGNVEVAQATGPFTAQVRGWAIDPDTASPVAVHVYVNGAWGGAYTANGTRTDVGRAYPLYGSAHGFDLSIPIRGGTNEVCVYGINQGIGSNALIRCSTVQGATGNPFGNIESASVSAAGRLVANGWVIDPDTPSPVQIHAYVDGAWAGSFSANGTRNDVARAYPGYGAQHGVDTVTPAIAPGRHEVCLYAINVGGGTTNPLMGCRIVTR